jgi:hypothetical protein
MVFAELAASTEFWAAIAGAVVGVLGSGVISASLQALANRVERERRERERMDQRKALGQAVLLKMMDIHANIEAFRRFVRECLSEAGDMSEMEGMIGKFALSPDAHKELAPLMVDAEQLARTDSRCG